MISKEEYLKNPCGTLSIPYYKSKVIKTPEHIKIFHEDDILNGVFADCIERKFLRLKHELRDILDVKLSDGYNLKIIDKLEFVYLFN